MPEVLEAIADRLSEISSASEDAVLSSDLTRISLMVRAVAGEYDSCVESRLKEAEGLARWLSQVAALDLPASERAELEQVLRTAKEQSDELRAGELRVSALEARLDALRRAAGTAQGVLETREDPESRRLLAESWRFLGAALRRGASMERLW